MAAMSDEKIIEILSGLILEIVGVQGFTATTTMEEVQEWDSLKHIQLLMAIEDTFEIEIPFEDAIQMISGEVMINKVRHYINDK